MKKNIVILGAGFGGLRATRQIHKFLRNSSFLENYRIFLIEKNDFHSFAPLWHEIATTSEITADNSELKSLVAYPLSELFAGKKIEIITDEIQKIDVERGTISLKKSFLSFDYLILAIGSTTNYFEIPGLEEKSIAFKSFDDAILVRNTIWNAISQRKGLPSRELKDLQILIGGGGSTGCELAGEIKFWTSEIQKESGPGCGTQITIIEQAQTILPSLNKKIIRIAEKRFEKLEVKILASERITKTISNAVILESGKIIPFDIFIWTGGVKNPMIIQKLPLRFDSEKRIKTMEMLECLPRDEKTKFGGEIFALGDLVADGPQAVRTAISQADIVAKNVIKKIRLEQKLSTRYSPESYKPKVFPFIIPIAGKFAIAKIGPFVISGFWAWILKGLVELNYLISIMSFWKALKIWLKGLKVFIQDDRLG